MAWQDMGSPLNNSATGVAAAQVVATLTPVAGNLAYIQGFTVTALAPASTVGGLVTVTGVVGGPLNYQFTESATVGGLLQIDFPDPKGIVAANRGGAITVTLPAIVSGGAGAVSAYGYQL